MCKNCGVTYTEQSRNLTDTQYQEEFTVSHLSSEFILKKPSLSTMQIKTNVGVIYLKDDTIKLISAKKHFKVYTFMDLDYFL